MKKGIFILLVSLFFGLLTGSLSAQTKGKFAHIDSQALILSMPERDAAQKTITDEASALETELTSMQEEFQKKYKDYLDKRETLTDLVKQSKEAELQDLQTRIQSFQTTAQDQLEKKEAELLQPIVDKAKKAIEDVAKEKGYIYVFDISAGSLLYYSTESEDIIDLVKKKLGITETPKK